MEFKKYKLSDVIESYDKKRKPISSIKRHKIKGCYPYYGAQEVIDYINDYIFDGTFILLAEDGENLRSRIKPLVKMVNGKFWLNNHAHIFKSKAGILIEYIYYYLLNFDFSSYITGSTQPKLNQENMNNIEIKIPSLENQQKIVKILSCLDAKIELNNRINDKLYSIADLMILDNFKENDKIELKRIIKFVKGKKPKEISNERKKSFQNYLTIACLNNQEINYANPEKMVITESDILMIMDGASSGNVFFSNKGIVGSTLSRVDIINSDFISEYVYFALKKHSKIINEKTTGSAIPHTDKNFVNDLLIPEIDMNKQRKYISILKTIKINENQNINLINIRNILLQKLMSGAIDLDNIEV